MSSKLDMPPVTQCRRGRLRYTHTEQSSVNHIIPELAADKPFLIAFYRIRMPLLQAYGQ